MRILPSASLLALSTLASACGGGDNPEIVVPDADVDAPSPDAPIDAPPAFDFSCMSNPAPGTAADPITVSGSATNLNVIAMQQEPVADATVTARDQADQAIGDPATTDAQGAWTLTLATGGAPLDGYIEAAKEEHRTVRVYPPQPLTADQPNVPALLFSNTDFSVVVGGIGAEQSPENGTVGLVILDCASTPIGGATISVTQNGTEVGEQFDLSSLQPGAWLVFDVPPGETEVTAEVNGMALRTFTIGVAAASNSTTIIYPGFLLN